MNLTFFQSFHLSSCCVVLISLHDPWTLFEPYCMSLMHRVNPRVDPETQTHRDQALYMTHLLLYASVQRPWNTGRGARKPLCTYVHFSIVIGHKNNWYSSSQCHHKQSSGPSEYVRILRKHSDLQINQYTTITSYWLYMSFPQFLSNSLAKNEISITSPWAQIIEEICEMAWENPSVEFWKTDNDEKSGFDHNFVFIPEIYLEIFTFIPPKQNLFFIIIIMLFSNLS